MNEEEILRKEFKIEKKDNENDSYKNMTKKGKNIPNLG